MGDAEKLHEYRLKRNGERKRGGLNTLLQIRWQVIALRMEVRSSEGGRPGLIMTSRKKVQAPFAFFRAMGFKASTKEKMLKLVEEWCVHNGMILPRS
jgi:hypothetical protein